MTSAAVILTPTNSGSLLKLAAGKLSRDRLAIVALIVLLAYFLLLLLSASGLIAADWREQKAESNSPPAFFNNKPSASIVLPVEQQHQTIVNPRDRLASILTELRNLENAEDEPISQVNITDPLASSMAKISKINGTETSTRQALFFGSDRWGRDVLSKTIKGTQTSMIVGIGSALLACLIGTLLGALAGYYGGWIDSFLNWFYSIFTAIPGLLLILAVAAVLQSKGIMTIILILGFTGWTGVFRYIRGEYLKQKARDYVRAAKAIGASDSSRMFRHILPNVSHIIFVELSLLTVGFIKSEVILSFLGFGVAVDQVSWGSMLNEAQNELLLGYWWQMAAATLAMAGLVTAFSIFTDVLRDALDPRLR